MNTIAQVIKTLFFTTLVSLTIFNTAQAGQWGIGITAGKTSFDVLDGSCERVVNRFVSCTADDSDTSFGLNMYYKFNKVWGIEAGYMDLGNYSATLDIPYINVSNNDLITSDLSSLYFVGTATYNIADNWSATGRLGAAALTLDVSIDQRYVTLRYIQAEKQNAIEVMAGGSLDYHFNDRFSLGLRFDYFANDESITVYGLTANYDF